MKGFCLLQKSYILLQLYCRKHALGDNLFHRIIYCVFYYQIIENEKGSNDIILEFSMQKLLFTCKLMSSGPNSDHCRLKFGFIKYHKQYDEKYFADCLIDN